MDKYAPKDGLYLITATSLKHNGYIASVEKPHDDAFQLFAWVTDQRLWCDKPEEINTFRSVLFPEEHEIVCEREDVELADRAAKLSEFNNKFWYGRGTNHRVEKDGIVRDLGWMPRWFIQVDNLKEFVASQVDKCLGGCGGNNDADIIMTIDKMTGLLEIELYDKYRE